MKNLWICLVAATLAIGCGDDGDNGGATDATSDASPSDTEDAPNGGEPDGDTGEEGDAGADTTDPDAAVPDTAVPDGGDPDAADPDAADPDAAGPDAADPDVADPDVADPDVADPDAADPDAADPDAADLDTGEPLCKDDPTCECVLEECAGGLGLPPETACSALAGDPCVDELIAVYQQGGCGVECGGITKEMWGALCELEACAAAKGLLDAAGMLTTQCEECACLAQCGGNECGDNGCGGSCGQCAGAGVCEDGLCVCTPDCGDKECGDDGCGESCGECDAGLACSSSGQCDCAPDCLNKLCGGDGCGGTCGDCPGGETCSQDGSECIASGSGPPTTCDEAHGLVGCCFEGDVYYFEDGLLQGAPGACGEASCGWDPDNDWYSCGFEGEDPSGTFPIACFGPNPAPETCPECSCQGKLCGNDGCGGSCGTCDGGLICGSEFQCVEPGTLQCLPSTACDAPDQCTCTTCVTDGVCTLDDDCVCPDCAADAFCGDPSNCNNDGVCDMYNEGCVCADCAAIPICQ